MFNTVEFYILTAFIAAAVIAFAAMPSQKSAARNFFYAGDLFSDAEPSAPGIVAIVEDDGRLAIHRFGLQNIGMDGAYSIAVTIIGFDVTIEERLTAGTDVVGMATAGKVVLDCLGAERYHIHYRNEAMGRSAAFSLNIRPGNRVDRLLE